MVMVPICYKHHIKNIHEHENAGDMERTMFHFAIYLNNIYCFFGYLNNGSLFIPLENAINKNYP